MSLPPDPPLSTPSSNLFLKNYCPKDGGKHNETVINKLNQLLNIIDIVKMDRKVVVKALNSKFRDFEDALQNFAAVEKREIDIILARNLKDFKHSELAVLTPETYLRGRKASG